MSPEPPAQPVTLSDVARRAGVSQSTASRVLNGSSRQVSRVLAERVLTAAGALHYTANVQAQAVARGTTMTVALLVSDIATAYFSSMAAALMLHAEQAGLRVTVAVTERRVEREIELVRELGTAPMETFEDGVIVNRIIDACYRSMRSGTWERVEPQP